MSNIKKELRDRILAMCLSILLLIGMLPINTLQVFAATTNYPDAFTFTVTDGTNPIEGASVHVYLEGDLAKLDITKTTDANGEINFPEVTDYSETGSEILANYSVSKDGYVQTDGIVDTTSYGSTGNIDVTLDELVLDIPATDYSISGWEGNYDGQSHTVSVIADGYTIMYSEDNITFSNDAPTLTAVGEKTVYIQLSKSGYNTLTIEKGIKINPAERDDFAFATPAPADIDYTDGLTYTNIASSLKEPEAVSYKSSDESVATVDNDGKVSFTKAGTVTITATMAASTNYNQSTKVYTITVNTIPRTSFGFETTEPSDITYQDELTYDNAALDPTNDGTITYSLVSQERDGSSVNDVATIDSATGHVTIRSAGTITVKAVVSKGNIHKTATATYSLTINRATQTGFEFENENPNNLAYNESYQNVATGGQSSGNISYEITSGSEYVSIQANGTIQAIGVGEATVKATKAADSRYETATATYAITTIKAEQTGFAFENLAYEVDYGTKMLAIKANGGESSEGVSYEIISGSDIGFIENATTGVITFNSGLKGTITVKATKESDEHYNLVSNTCTVKVKHVDYRSNYTLVGNKGDNGWYTNSVDVTANEGYLVSTSDSFSASWSLKLTYEAEGNNENIIIFLKNKDTGAISDAITVPTFNIDKTNPTTLDISYSKSILNTILNAISFGFYDSSITVTLTATDSVSGIDHFVYNIGNGDVTISKDNLSFDEDKATASFTIDKQYKGCVSAVAYDASGRKISNNDEKIIVLDNIAPGVTVTYDNNNASNTNYYKADRRATIEIKEDNFYAEDVLITVGKRLNSETEFTESSVSPTFNLVGDKYVATIDFNENADYTFDISYTDKSGNTFDSYVRDEFTIDKIDPVISINYDNNSVLNNSYYKNDRTATITITEHNFQASDIKAYVTSAKDIQGNSVTLSNDLSEYLKNSENWTKSGDVYFANVTFEWNANYIIDITYNDLADRSQVNAIHDEFTVDKESPNNLTIDYGKSVLDTVLETISFGFYQTKPTVTITAEDSIAGIDYFTYSCIVSDNVSETNSGVSNVKINSDDISYSDNGKKATATFEIEPQFRGYVQFTATDKAGQTSEVFTDTNVIVVDNVAPGVNVKYDNNSVTNTNYYKSVRTATITINEANYFESDITDGLLVITVGKRLNDEATYTETTVVPTFSKNGDIYSGIVEFDEDADYTFDIKYTDHSGNVFDSYVKDEFTIDKTNPAITVNYDNNDCVNANQFKANRTATITILEHNFNASDVVATVTAKNASANNVSIADYATYLKNAENWVSNGDVHTASITFTAEANYNFGVSYIDMAGNQNDDIDFKTSIAPTKFTVDKTIPTASIKIGSWEQSTNGTKWDHFLTSTSFNLWDNDAVTVCINNADSLSGVDIIEHFRTDEPMTEAEVRAYTNWISVGNNKQTFSYNVHSDERFIVYVHIVDKAGNELYLSSDGIIIDKTLPKIEKIAPEITVKPTVESANGIFNNDVKMDVVVKDPAVASDNTLYSGLKSITYEIFNNSVSTSAPTQQGILFDFANTKLPKDSHGLIQVYDKNACITVDKTKNNSNDIVVKVTATDNAGNTSTKICNLKIDITAPTINISYDNNITDSGSYFKDNRTATVVITERNFNSDDVKINISNTDGVIPTISAWRKSQGSGNSDNTTWTATLSYIADGDYTFSIAYADLAGNKCADEKYANGTVAEKSFTIDKTNPTIKVGYDNNSVKNNNYYKANRVATIVITEHNFNVDRVKISLTATNEGSTATLPKVSRWSSNGDKHTATISYSNDALYSFDITVNDKAGNNSADFAKQTFYVDKTVPELKIAGISNNSANNGDVIPVITYSDANYDAKNVTVTLSGANRKTVSLDGAYSDIQNGRTFTFKNFEKTQAVDDIYTLTATLTDKAGNTSTKTVHFSVNRFGSTYELSNEIEKLIGAYVKSPIDVTVSETNPNELSNIKITMFKNNNTITLSEGNEYKVDIEGGNGEWYKYTYTIYKSNFEDDGVYKLVIHSEDSAGNIAENALDTKNKEISFGIDKTQPTVNLKNIENGKTYALDSMSLQMSATDNLKLSVVTVYLDGKEYKKWSGKELENIIAQGGNFNFEINGDSTSAHTVKVIAADAVGNECSEEIHGFYVTTNLWVRYYNNKALFFGSIGGLIFVAGLIVFLTVWKKKRR